MTALVYAALSLTVVPCLVAFVLAATDLIEAARARRKARGI